MTGMPHTLRYCEWCAWLTAPQADTLAAQLAGRMQPDPRGPYPLSDLYYDTSACGMARASLEAPRRKELFRLRSHGQPGPDAVAYAEIRRTLDDAVCKRRAAAPLAGLGRMLGGEVLPGCDAEVQRELHWMVRRYGIAPRAWVGCERTAYTGLAEPDLRITIDRAIRWRADRLGLTGGADGAPLRFETGAPDAPPRPVMLKLRFDRAVPLWLSGLLAGLAIRPGGLSKYGVCYRQHLAPVLQAERSDR